VHVRQITESRTLTLSCHINLSCNVSSQARCGFITVKPISFSARICLHVSTVPQPVFEAFLDLMCFKGGASQLALPPAHPTCTPTHFVRYYPMVAYDARGHLRLSFLAYGSMNDGTYDTSMRAHTSSARPLLQPAAPTIHSAANACERSPKSMLSVASSTCCLRLT
jgi:hypothetical protein